MKRDRTPRLPWLMLGGVALLAGLYTGLQRIGWSLPLLRVSPGDHGPLMVSGFLGTVIALERAVALQRRWGYFAPICAGLGALMLTIGALRELGAWLLVAGSAGVVAVLIHVVTVDRSLHHLVMAAGAVCWFAGNVAWALGQPVFAVALAWACYLVLTIAGERLELNRVLPPGRLTRPSFVAAAGALLVGLVISAFALQPGMRVAGAGLLALAIWLYRYDIARRTVRQRGLVRFIAVCLLAGYFWLGTAGVLALRFGNPFAGPIYDALLHSVFVGFVFSMIFGHAPVIVPAVLGVRIDYRPRFYLHAAALHLALAVRVLGDLLLDAALRRWGALGTAVAVLLFVANTVASMRRARPVPAVQRAP